MYIQDIKLTHESTKGKYFLITTKSDYKKASIEAKDTINYVYPNRATNTFNIQAHTMKAPSSAITYPHHPTSAPKTT